VNMKASPSFFSETLQNRQHRGRQKLSSLLWILFTECYMGWTREEVRCEVC